MNNLQEQEHPQKEINFCENCDSIIHFSATFCDESCRLNYEENQSKPILQDQEQKKVKCDCPCHKNKNIKHFMACCENGYKIVPNWFPEFKNQPSRPILQDNVMENGDKINEIKQSAEKLAAFFGYNINSLSIDVINVKDAYCRGYFKCWAESAEKIKSLQNKIKELENDYMKIQTELQTAKFIKDKTSR